MYLQKLMKMKKSILFFFLSLAIYFAFGQCGPYRLNGSCTSVPTLTGAAAAAKIIWEYNGIVYDTLHRGAIGPVTTVAGGNGQGSAANQLNGPSGIYADRSGNLYISDAGNNRIQKFPAGSTSATNGISVAGSYSAVSVCLDSTGNIYVVDFSDDQIKKFPANSTIDTNGVIIIGQTGSGSGASFLSSPYGVFVDNSGYIYVADYDNSRIQKFPPSSTQGTNGTTVAGGNYQGTAANQISPYGVYVDAIGNIYVADAFNHRIQKFPSGSTSATNGTTVAGGNGAGSAANQLNYPTGVFVDSLGNIYVADEFNNRIQKFPAGSTSATNGITVAGGNGNGSNGDQLSNPRSVYVDRLGNIYIADEQNNRVQKWSQPAIFGIDTALSFNATGTFSAIVIDTFGCIAYSDTISINLNPQASISQNICHGHTYAFNGHNLTTSGTYSDTTISSGGCDSITTLTLTVYPISSDSISRSICQGDTYTFNGNNVANAGIYYDTLVGMGVHGCDSVVTLILNVYPLAIGSVTQAICPGSHYTLGTNTYTTTGIYTDTLTGAAMHGCDSIVTLNLIVLDTTTAYFHLQPSDSAHVWFIINQSFGTNLTYVWNWGDSTSSTGDTPSHIYAVAGYYNICVTVTDSAGCSAMYCDTNVYLFKDQSGQMVYVSVLPQYPAGINTINSDHLNINYYGSAVHFSEALQAPTQLKLYDLSGRVVMEQDNFGGSVWNVNADIAQGVYVLQLQNGSYSLSKKLMILK